MQNEQDYNENDIVIPHAGGSVPSAPAPAEAPSFDEKAIVIPHTAPVVDTATDVEDALNTRMAQQWDGYVARSREFEMSAERDRRLSGAGALKSFNTTMDMFASADWKNDVKVWEQVRMDVKTEATEHALTNPFIVEAFSDGAWNQARSMTSDEHWGLLGTDLRARNQFIHDASEKNGIAQMLGLSNSDEYLEQVALRGVDAAEPGDWLDSLKDISSSLGTYDDIADMITKRVDANWDKAAQDNAWEAMNSTPQGRFLVESTGITPKHIAEFTNGDALIYAMSRLYNEKKFAQHSSQDKLGGTVQMFGQMLPTILNDPDTIGEVGLALLLALPSGGASVAANVALRVGSGAKTAQKLSAVAKGFATAGKALPTRVLGDLVVPGVRGFRAAGRAKEFSTVGGKLGHAWRNLDHYDSWTTFALGASADGVAGGVGAFLMNTTQMDDLNAIVYGKGKMPSVRNFDMIAQRGLMGIGGALVLGSTLRVGFKGLASLADASIKDISSSFSTAKSREARAKASGLVTEGVIRKHLARAGSFDEGTVIALAAKTESQAAAAGVSPSRVAADAMEHLDASTPPAKQTPQEAVEAVNTMVNKIIAKEANTPLARSARAIRAAEQVKAINKGVAGERIKAEAQKVEDDLTASAIVRTGTMEGNSVKDLGDASSTDAVKTEATGQVDTIIEANSKLDEARAEVRQAGEDRAAQRREAKKTEDQLAEDLKKQQDDAQARNEAAGKEKAARIAKAEKDASDAQERANSAAVKLREAAEVKAKEDAAAEAKVRKAEEAAAAAQKGADMVARQKDADAEIKAAADKKAADTAAAVAAVKAKLEAELAAAKAKQDAVKKAADEAAQKLEEANAKTTAAQGAEVKVEEIPTARVPETETTKQDAKRNEAAASQKVHAAEEALAAARQKMADEMGVKVEVLDSLVAEAVSWRLINTRVTHARNMVQGFDNQDMESIPTGVARNILATVNPEFAQKWNVDSDTVTADEIRAAIKDAAINDQGVALRALTEDPNTIFSYSRWTRGGYKAIAENLEAVKDEGPAQAYRVAATIKALQGGGDLRDYDFSSPDGKAYLTDAAFFSKAMDNLEAIRAMTDGEGNGFKLDKSLDTIREEVKAETEARDENSQRAALKNELYRDFGYHTRQKFTNVSPEDLQLLVANHRYVAQIDQLASEGKLTFDQRELLGLSSDAQQVYLTSLLTRVNQRIDELKAEGESLLVGEVEVNEFITTYYGDMDLGSNLRDAIFNDARATATGDDFKFDLGKVRQIAEERLARVDSDFNMARVAAASAELRRLEGKVVDGTDTFEDRIKLAKFNNKNKTINEIDYLGDKVLEPYRIVSAEAATARKARLIAEYGEVEGPSKWEEYLEEELGQINEGLRKVLFSNQGLSANDRNTILMRAGIDPEQRGGTSARDKWEVETARKIGVVVEAELGIKLSDLTDGTEGFLRGKQVGMAAVTMLRDGRTLTGDSPGTISADSKSKSHGETYSHVRFSAARDQNPTGNLSTKKLVTFIERYMLAESERQVLFTADGKPRELSITESQAIIDFYEGMKTRSSEDIQANTPEHPFEQKDRTGANLVSRTPNALGSPVKNWLTPKERADAIVQRMLTEPVSLHQGVHDDLTLAMVDGVATNVMGAVGPMVARNSQGSGDLYGYGAGWQSLAATPGSIMDWLNIRSAMVFRQFEGMDQFSRAMGLKSLNEMRDALVTDMMARGNSDVEVTPSTLKGEALNARAKELGIKGKMSADAKRLAIGQAEAKGGLSRADAEKAAEVKTLIELDTAVRLLDRWVREESFANGDLGSARNFENKLNSWDASSQAVSLAMGLQNAAIRDSLIAEGGTFTGGLETIKRAMGWDKTEGLISEDIRMQMLRDSRTVDQITGKMAEEDLAEIAADFYSKVWDDMLALDPEDRKVRNASSGNMEDVPGRMRGFVEDEEGTIHVEDAHSESMQGFVNPEQLGRAADMWNNIFDTVGVFGSKTEIGNQKAEAKAANDPKGVAAAEMKKWMRDKLMKRPVMTRAYGAGGDAMTNAVADFLMEAFTVKTEQAAAFRKLIQDSDPEMYDLMMREAEAGDRSNTTMVWQMAANLGWAFADANPNKPDGAGSRMAGALAPLSDAKTFRDEIRATLSLHDKTFSADGDLTIDGYVTEKGSNSIEVRFKEGSKERRAITLDDLYNTRSSEDTRAFKAPKPEEGASAADKAEAERVALEKSKQHMIDVQRQITDKAIEVAERRGWNPDAGDELLDTLGRWHMRNLLLVKSGAATLEQVQKSELNVQEQMKAIIDEGGPAVHSRLAGFLEGWLTRRDESTIRSMNSIGFRLRDDVVPGALGRVGMEVSDLNPKYALQMATGAPLHGSIASSAGRGWAGKGQSDKGVDIGQVDASGLPVPKSDRVSDADGSIYAIDRAWSDETEFAANNLDRSISREWADVDAEERIRIAHQLAAQDLMLDFLGTQNPPLHLAKEGVKFQEPTELGFYQKWASQDERAETVREGMDEIRQRHAAQVMKDDGALPDELADILQNDVRSQTSDTLGKTLFGRANQDDMTDGGIPQMQIARLKRTADGNAQRQLKAAKSGTVTGNGITLSELAVPARLTFTGGMAKPVDMTPVGPSSKFGGERAEQDQAWFNNWTMKEVSEYGASLGKPVTDEASFREAFAAMHMERAIANATGPQSGAARLADQGSGKASDHSDIDMNTADGRKKFMDRIHNDINTYFEELFGETQVAAKKEAGTRDVQQLDNDPVAFPSHSLLDGITKSFTKGGNRNNADALLGPAARAGVVLEGDNVIPGALLTGLMAKSVFHNDFGIGMGGADEAIRFGAWFLRQKFAAELPKDLTAAKEYVALHFDELSARRLENDADGKYYEKQLALWQGGKVPADEQPSHVSSLMGMGVVRERLANDPEALAFAQDTLGIEKPSDLTDKMLLELLQDETSGVSVQRTETMSGEAARLPDVYMDTLGREMTSPRVKTGSILWRTMAQYRSLGIDPKSQPMVRRLWFAAAMEMEVGRLNLPDNMGARERNSRAFSNLAGGKVSEDRIDASREALGRVHKGTNTWGAMDLSGPTPEGLQQKHMSFGQIAYDRGALIYAQLKRSGANVDDLVTTKVDAFNNETEVVTGSTAQGLYAYELAGGDYNKFMALTQHGQRAVSNDTSSVNYFSSDLADPTNDVAKDTFNSIKKFYSAVDEDVKAQLVTDVEALMSVSTGKALDSRRFLVSRANAVVTQMNTQNALTDAGAATVVADTQTRADAKTIFEGDPDAPSTDVVFGGGRALVNDMDSIVRGKRYPAIHSLVENLKSNGVFKDEAAAREFALLLSLNADVVGDLLPGIKFSFVGEAGTARMQTDIVAGQLKHRVEILDNMRGLDGVAAFDIIAHELGHAIVHRGMADMQGRAGGARSSGAANAFASLTSQFRHRIVSGGAEARAQFTDAFVAIHGAERGTEYATKFFESVAGSEGRSAYDPQVQEFMAQMMSWHMLSKNEDTLKIVMPFMEELSTMYKAGYGEKMRRIIKTYDNVDALRAKGIEVDPSKQRSALARLSQIANTAEPTIWRGKKAWRSEVMNHPGSIDNLQAKRADLLAKMDAEGYVADAVDTNLLASLNNRINEVGGNAPSRESLLKLQQQMFNPETGAKDYGIYKGVGMDPARILDLQTRSEAGELIPFDQWGMVDLKKLNSHERAMVTNHMIESKIAGKRETFGDSKVRSFITMMGEGMAMQGTSSALRSMDDAVQVAHQGLNSGMGFQERSSSQAFDTALSIDQINIMSRALYGKAMSASVELFTIAQKGTPEKSALIDAAFEETFRGINPEDLHDPGTPLLDKLEKMDPQAANLVEVAGKDFAKLYDMSYTSANAVGEVKDWVAGEVTGDGHRSLPVQLSHVVKEDGALRTLSNTIADDIRAQALKRFNSPLVREDGSSIPHAGHINGQFLTDYGILAPNGVKRATSPQEQVAHVERLDKLHPNLVDEVLKTAKNGADAEQLALLGGTRAASFYAASEMILRGVERGKFFAADMPPAMAKAYQQAMDGASDPKQRETANEVPFYERHIDTDFPDPKDRAAVRAILGAGDTRPDAAGYEAIKMLYRSRYGGYSFADNKFMSSDAFREAVSQTGDAPGRDSTTVAGRGWNSTPLNVIKSFMSYHEGIMDKFFNQQYYGIKGFGYDNLLNALEARLEQSINSERGVAVKLTERQRSDVRKQIKSLRDQANLARGRNPKFENDSGMDIVDAIAPYVQTAVGLATTPNWTTASLVVEGTAGMIHRALRAVTDGTDLSVTKYTAPIGQLRDEMHAIGITMPYHMTKLGFGHIWNMGDEAAAAMDLDPALKESGHDKMNKGMRKLGSAGFERVQLAQRQAAMLPSQQFLRKQLIADESGTSRAERAAKGLDTWIKDNPDGVITKKVIKTIARDSGLDLAVAMQMHGMGLLRPDIVKRMGAATRQFMQADSILDYEGMFDAVAWSKPRFTETGLVTPEGEALTSAKVASGIQQLLFNQVARTNMEPRVGTTNLSANPLIRMWQQLSQYSVLFMREVMAATATVGTVGVASLLMPLYMGEVVWYSINRMKNGESPEAIAESWKVDPLGQMTAAATRMPIFGAGSFISDMMVNTTAGLANKTGLIGDTMSTQADKRTFGQDVPGLPGPAMMLQLFGAVSDLAKGGTEAMMNGDMTTAMGLAKEFAYDYTPVDGRPLWSAAARLATSDFDEAKGTPDGDRTPAMKAATAAGVLPSYTGSGRNRPRAADMAADYAERKADSLIGSKPPVSARRSEGEGSPTNAAQAAPAPAPAPSGDAGSGSFGAGSSGTLIADKLKKIQF